MHILGLRTEDPLRHVKHYLSIVDNIQADGATRDTSRLRFFYFPSQGKWQNGITEYHSLKSQCGISSYPDSLTISFRSLTEEEGWNRIEEYIQYQDDLWDEPSPSMNISSISEAMQPTLRGHLKRAWK
ncbi:hypothetical protein Tco_1293947 [Tanacetum coccineum]